MKPVETQETTMPDLLPCPFCGSTKLKLENLGEGDDWFVSCAGCEVQQIANYLKDVAVKRWNQRAVSPSLIETPKTPTKEAYEAQGNTSPEPPDTTGRPESTGFEVLVKIHTKDADQKLHSPELLRFLVGKVIDSRYRLEEEIDYTLEVKRVYR